MHEYKIGDMNEKYYQTTTKPYNRNTINIAKYAI